MDISLLTTPQPLDTQQLDTAQRLFDVVEINSVQSETVYSSLDAFFADRNVQHMQQYYHTYWRWYVTLVWKRLLSVEPDAFSRTFVATLSSAFLLDQRVEGDMLFYLYRRVDAGQKQEAFFEQLRSAFLESALPVNPFDPSLTWADFVAEAKQIRKNTTSTLELAEAYSKLEQRIVTEQSQFAGVEVDKEELVKRMVQLAYFFSEDRDIADIVEEFVGTQNAALDHLGEPNWTDEVIEKINNGTAWRVVNADSVAGADEVAKEEESPNKKQTPSYTEIREMVDKPGVEMEEIISKLDALADEYGDSRIRDLYVFDETVGDFAWDDELLRSNGV